MSAWDAEVGSANWGREGESATGSGYPEKKDEAGTETEEGASINWPPVPSEQAVTQGPASEPSAVVMARPAGTGAPAAVSGTAATTRRPSMAFEIARVERAGKLSPPNPTKAAHAWNLSRPRYVERLEQPGRRIRLLPGQEHRDAIPYGVWGTSWAQMGDFGLDVGMYFVTIAQLTGATLVYAALSVVAMVHFSSGEYSQFQPAVRIDLRGSAVCTELQHVLVYTRSLLTENRPRHDCPLDAKQGFADMVGVLLLFLMLFVLGKAQDKAAEYLDTQVHTGQPYTVKVSSPDPLADDPERWRRLFAQFGHVSYVTVCRGNGALLRALAERRAAGRKLESSTTNINEVIEAYKAVDDDQRPSIGRGAWWKAIVQPLGFCRDTLYWKQRLWTMHDHAECEVHKGMHDQGLPVEKVFITFESNLSQGRCLSHMSRGILETPEEQHMYTNPDGFKESLRVMPASAASEVVYENLHVRLWQRLLAQVVSFALSAAIVAVTFLVADRLRDSSTMAVAIVLVLVDCSLPWLVQTCSSLERHHNAIAHELSVMNKLTLARWANLVVIPLLLLRNREDTLSQRNLELIANVLWLNLFVPSALRLLDFRGRWNRHVQAPKEMVQSAMDAHFRGSRWDLYERYSDMTKTIFACLIFAPLFPLGMWICAASLALSYWTDKYMFLCAWRTPQPATNSGAVAKLARRHLALAVLAHCLSCLYYYSGWPFDRICRFDDGNIDGWTECSQEGTGFVESEPQLWMPGHQKTLVDVFSSLNVAWLSILLLFYYLQSIVAGFSLVLKGAPRQVRTRQHMPFSQLTSRFQHEVDAYVPQICSDDQPLPLLACDLDMLEPETIPWKVDGRKGDSFEDHCLSSSRDLPRISRYQRARLFSLCSHYPPPAPFEGIGNGRVPKTDVDWFRRPPGLQETKVPEVGFMSESRGAEGEGGEGGAIQRVERVDHPALVEGALAEQEQRDSPEEAVDHQKQTTKASSQGTEHNGQGSVVPSYLSKEGEEEPMMPGGAQSSVVSTAIVDVADAEAHAGAVVGKPSGASRNGAVVEDLSGSPTVKAGVPIQNGRVLSLAVDDEGVVEASEVVKSDATSADEGPSSPFKLAVTPGTSGRSVGVKVQPVDSPAASSSSNMSYSLALPVRERTNQRVDRPGHGEEGSDIKAGEEAEEYATRINRRLTAAAATATAHAAAVAAAAAAAAVAAARVDDGRGMHLASATRYVHPGEFHLCSEIPNLVPEDGDYSFYNESHGPYDVEMEDETPTPIRDRGLGVLSVENGGLNCGAGAGISARERYLAHTTNSSDGWVDQYTNCTLARDDPPRVERSYTAAANPIRTGPWRTSGFSPAV